MSSLIALALGGSLLGIVPLLLAVVALVDAIRVGADWYWFLIILSFPVVGSIAYFVVVRSPLLGNRQATMVSPVAARRRQARRRLAELNVQLAHWRGPANLSDAGDELLALGKPKPAEALFRESLAGGGAVEDVHFGLAQALEMQGRWEEAIPYLRELVRQQPDARLGQALLHLGRSLDEAGHAEEAEAVLKKVLERRTIIEAQVRLARRLEQRGEKEAAERLIQEVAIDAKILPRYLKREHGPWIRAARLLRAGMTRLPSPQFEGSYPPGYLLKRIAWVAAAALAVFLLFAYLSARMAERMQAAPPGARPPVAGEASDTPGPR